MQLNLLQNINITCNFPKLTFKVTANYITNKLLFSNLGISKSFNVDNCFLYRYGDNSKGVRIGLLQGKKLITINDQEPQLLNGKYRIIIIFEAGASLENKELYHLFTLDENQDMHMQIETYVTRKKREHAIEKVLLNQQHSFFIGGVDTYQKLSQTADVYLLTKNDLPVINQLISKYSDQSLDVYIDETVTTAPEYSQLTFIPIKADQLGKINSYAISEPNYYRDMPEQNIVFLANNTTTTTVEIPENGVYSLEFINQKQEYIIGIYNQEKIFISIFQDNFHFPKGMILELPQGQWQLTLLFAKYNHLNFRQLLETGTDSISYDEKYISDAFTFENLMSNWELTDGGYTWRHR